MNNVNLICLANNGLVLKINIAMYTVIEKDLQIYTANTSLYLFLGSRR